MRRSLNKLIPFTVCNQRKLSIRTIINGVLRLCFIYVGGVFQYLVKTKSADSCDCSREFYASALLTKLVPACHSHPCAIKARTSVILRGEIQQDSQVRS